MTRRQIVTTLILIAAVSVGAAASKKPVAEEPGPIKTAAFIAKDENRGRSIHVGQGITVKTELIIIR